MKKALYIPGTALVLTVLAGCGNPPTGNDPPVATKGSVMVTVKEHPAKGLPGFEVATLPATVTAITDSEGNALLEEITPGSYMIFVRKDGYHEFMKTVMIDSGVNNVSFSFLAEVTASVRDDLGKPCAGAVITTDPPFGTWTTDTEGKTVFKDMPEMQYRFIIHREKYGDTVISAYLAPTVNISVPTGSPEIRIIRPVMNTEFISTSGITTYKIRFTGEGTDQEDGRLSGNALAWYSDINGLLGYGEEITFAALDKGIHTISLVGTDSNGKKGSASVTITLFTYELDNYYPTPKGESWKYRYLTPEFYVTTEDGGKEYWVMKDMTAKLETEDERKVTLLYDIARDGKVVHCRYTVSDILSKKDGSVYVQRTAETVQEWESSVPYLEMHINTSYSPKLLILKNIDDISAERSYSAKSDITVYWQYTYYGNPSIFFQEWRPILNEFEVGDEEVVETDRGAVLARAVTMREKDGFARTWHVSRGLGIVRITDNAFALESAAVLKDASILRFIDQDGGTAKPVFSGTFRKAPTLDFHVNRKTGENMKKLTEHLRRMCPR
ncbi:MAG: hypothetical protein ACYC9O_10935 [Candidatus Latescibacterota bacterium]